jgi:hypothetical protein
MANSGPAVAAPNPKPGLPARLGANLNTLRGMGISSSSSPVSRARSSAPASSRGPCGTGEGAEAAAKLAAVGVACILVASGAGLVNDLVW